ncbi:hypothetical protein EWM64_g7475 [Hericium alpestre]|uniref:Uncharacterized protein n=1 Tax=Hericium alpestre TaxID=135208 RepID=A0A4Y9ZST0_9AGAM|nr:hypothetical protein EWM64_g7475 [Hericium alpestre]
MKTPARFITLCFHKFTAEHGTWDGDLLCGGELCWEAGTIAGKENAMLLYWIAAEQDYELVQNNLDLTAFPDKGV